MTTTKHTITTRRKRDTSALTTELTLDWTDCTEDDIRALATKTVIIKLQQPRNTCNTDAELRAVLPEHMTVRVADIEWGRTRKPRDPEAKARKDLASAIKAGLTREQLAAIARELDPDDKLFD